MTSEEEKRERNRASVRRWYARHRAEYADLRRKRYASDAERRAKARENASIYRAKRRKGLRVERINTRELDGKTVPVYTSGFVADSIGCSQQVLRNWEARGWILKPLFPDRHRFYTAHQVELMKMLAAVIRDGGKTLRIPVGKEDKALLSMVSLIHKTWGADNGKKRNIPRSKRSG